MRYLWRPIVALILSATACTKEKVTPVMPPAIDSTNVIDSTDTTDSTSRDSTYIVNGLTDLTIGSYADSAGLVLAVTHISGSQEKVTFSISGLPDGVTAYFSPAASGIPSFSTTLSFNSSFAKEGKYTITITGKSASGVEKSYETILTVVDAAPPCNTLISRHASSFTTTITGGGPVLSTGAFFYFDTYLQYMYLETINGQEVRSYDYMGNSSGEVGFTADCKTGTIDIPSKVITVSTPAGLKNYTVYGSGTFSFDSNKIIIDYTVITDIQSFYYTMTADLYL